MNPLSGLASLLVGAFKPKTDPREVLGTLIPPGVEGPATGAPEDELYSGLKEEDRNAVLQLVRDLTIDADPVNRMALRRVRRNREYWAGRLLILWDDARQQYVPYTKDSLNQYGIPFEDEDFEDPPQSFHIYQATGLTVAATLTSARPTSRWSPGSAQNEDDLKTAAAACDIVELFDRNNTIEVETLDVAYYYFNDGFCAAHVRYVEDAKRFGTINVPRPSIPVEKQIAPGAWNCQRCGMQTTAEEGGPLCKECGEELPPETFTPPVMGTAMESGGFDEKPGGAELVDFYGRLEVGVYPPSAKRQSQYLALKLETEVDLATLRALYPKKAREIQQGSAGSDALAQEARIARASTNAGGWQGGTGNAVEDQKGEVTFSRVWVRPVAFYRLNDEALRDRLLASFSDGLMLASHGANVLEVRASNMDDEWVTGHAYPGPGQIRPAMGDAIVDIQDSVNDLLDAELQAARAAIPYTLMNSEVLERVNWADSKARGGNVYDVVVKDGSSLGDAVYETTPATIGAGAVSLRQELMGPILQQIAGVYPAAVGAGDPSLKTFRAYAQAREQAMQRFSIPWKSLKWFWVGVDNLAVQQFIRNRQADVQYVVTKDSGFEDKTISRDALKGRVEAFPEADEAFPTSPGDKREVLNKFFESQDPMLHGAATGLESLQGVKGLLGLNFLKFPGEVDWKKQAREIKSLLQGQPTPQVDPYGQPVLGPDGQPVLLPSIPIRDLTDNHAVEAQCALAWLHSEEGLETEISNNAGFLNVLAHAEAHIRAMAPAPAALGPPSPAGPSDPRDAPALSEIPPLPPDGGGQPQ